MVAVLPPLVLVRINFPVPEVREQRGGRAVLQSPFPKEPLAAQQTLESVSELAIRRVNQRVQTAVYPPQP